MNTHINLCKGYQTRPDKECVRGPGPSGAAKQEANKQGDGKMVGGVGRNKSIITPAIPIVFAQDHLLLQVLMVTGTQAFKARFEDARGDVVGCPNSQGQCGYPQPTFLFFKPDDEVQKEQIKGYP